MKIPENVPGPLVSAKGTPAISPVGFTKMPVSLVVITFNEEKNIERCIRSVPFATEVIVVDSLSQDRTTEIAVGLGARVIERNFEGYRNQKQFAIEQATQPWVLSLDADEALSAELQAEILRALHRPEFDGFRIPRCSHHLDRWIKHGGWYPDYQTRLFKKDSGRWVGGEVHEQAMVDGTLGTMESDILHFVFEDLTDQIETNNEFSSLGAKQLKMKGEAFSFLKLALRPVGKFFECYIWKKGFLDGSAGFIIALEMDLEENPEKDSNSSNSPSSPTTKF